MAVGGSLDLKNNIYEEDVMEEKMNAQKTRGAWVVTAKRNAEEKAASLQSDNHQNQQAGGQTEGGVR